jgi:hypothetical protein
MNIIVGLMPTALAASTSQCQNCATWLQAENYVTLEIAKQILLV